MGPQSTLNKPSDPCIFANGAEADEILVSQLNPIAGIHLLHHPFDDWGEYPHYEHAAGVSATTDAASAHFDVVVSNTWAPWISACDLVPPECCVHNVVLGDEVPLSNLYFPPPLILLSLPLL